MAVPDSTTHRLLQRHMLLRAYMLVLLLQGKLLAAVNNKVMLYKMSATADGRQELVLDCSPVGVQVLCLHLAVR